ncbi:MAG: glutathione binding-like protein, partial [Gammaproteobacteria bacterium]
IVDHHPVGTDQPVSVFESGAILLYLAEKTGKYIPQDVVGRVQVLEWLFWQMGGFGPMLGQNHHFGFYAKEKIPYAIDRYVKETSRLYGVLNKRLKGRDYICGDYSIADMACYPWTLSHQRQQQDLNDFPEVKRWHESIKSRPAVVRSYELPEKMNLKGGISDEAAKILFGQDRSVVR